MKYTLEKYHGKWAVYCEESRTYSFIGLGKKFCEKVVNKLNAMERD